MRHVRSSVYTVIAGGVVAGCLFLYTGTPHKTHKIHHEKNGPIGVQVTATPSATLTPSYIVSTPPLSHAGLCNSISVNKNDPQAVIPDSNCTPGAVNPAVTQATIGSTICVSGYTKTIRPTVGYTSALKRQQMAQYGFTDSISNHEEDHLISLELGGAPSDPKNLWPEPHAAPNEKDRVENYLHQRVCAGTITLTEAQREISTNWYSVFLNAGL